MSANNGVSPPPARLPSDDDAPQFAPAFLEESAAAASGERSVPVRDPLAQLEADQQRSRRLVFDLPSPTPPRAQRVLEFTPPVASLTPPPQRASVPPAKARTTPPPPPRPRVQREQASSMLASVAAPSVKPRAPRRALGAAVLVPVLSITFVAAAIYVWQTRPSLYVSAPVTQPAAPNAAPPAASAPRVHVEALPLAPRVESLPVTTPAADADGARERARREGAAQTERQGGAQTERGGAGQVEIEMPGESARVYWKRGPLGLTPARFELPAGTHTLLLKTPSGQTARAEVVVRAGKLTRVSVAAAD